jgi:excisionase family DNA binding protein
MARTKEQKEYYTDTELAEALNVHVQTLRAHRQKRMGIPFVKFGKLVRYRKKDLEAFMDSRLISTN